MEREHMNIVVIGHVDHGKSTVIGRLFADTGSLPKGKLEQVKAMCERNARPFEYAFLLDALKDEQSQGITIDTARCFFKTERRDYIIIDAPGHIEFLKNMVSGAARAETALLVIDAQEGIAENSKRHGYLMSMLGIGQIVVLVNKMDLVGYRQTVFDAIVNEYGQFLGRLGVKPVAYIPISARSGENLASQSASMPWYAGAPVLEVIDHLAKQVPTDLKPFRFPVQDIYKFTEKGDDRRIVAGTVESGAITTGEEVVFLPSGKRSRIRSIEGFNVAPRTTVASGVATGFTLYDELYLKPGEIMCRASDTLPSVTTRFRANIFWMGRAPMVRDKKYKLKVATARVTVRLSEVVSCIDAAELGAVSGKQQLDRHDVAECVFETTKPVAFDAIDVIESTGRFVIVDKYDIAGGGIITRSEQTGRSWLSDHIRNREVTWDKGLLTSSERAALNGHRAKSILICGDERRGAIARLLERSLFKSGFRSYYLGIDSILGGVDSDSPDDDDKGERLVYRIGELSRILTAAGLIFISAVGEIDDADIAVIRKLNEPSEVLVVSANGDESISGCADLLFDRDVDEQQCVSSIVGKLQTERIIPDYDI